MVFLANKKDWELVSKYKGFGVGRRLPDNSISIRKKRAVLSMNLRDAIKTSRVEIYLDRTGVYMGLAPTENHETGFIIKQNEGTFATSQDQRVKEGKFYAEWSPKDQMIIIDFTRPVSLE